MSNDDVKQVRSPTSTYPHERRKQARPPRILDAEQSARLRALLVRGIAGATAALGRHPR